MAQTGEEEEEEEDDAVEAAADDDMELADEEDDVDMMVADDDDDEGDLDEDEVSEELRLPNCWKARKDACAHLTDRKDNRKCKTTGAGETAFTDCQAEKKKLLKAHYAKVAAPAPSPAPAPSGPAPKRINWAARRAAREKARRAAIDRKKASEEKD